MRPGDDANLFGDLGPQSQCALSASRRCDWVQFVPRILTAMVSQCALSASRRCDGVPADKIHRYPEGLNAHLAQAGVATVRCELVSGSNKPVSQCALSASRRCDYDLSVQAGQGLYSESQCALSASRRCDLPLSQRALLPPLPLSQCALSASRRCDSPGRWTRPARPLCAVSMRT